MGPAGRRNPMDPPDQAQPGTVVRERLTSSAAYLRSPILEDRTIELAPLDPDRATVELPPLAELVGAMAWVLLPAVPCLVFVGWEAAIVAGGTGLFLAVLNRRTSLPGAAFAGGFLQFRGDDAPALGVQEEDDVRWRWRGGSTTGGREDGVRPPVMAGVDQPFTAPPVMPRTK